MYFFRPGLRQSQGAIHIEGAGGVNAHQLTGDSDDGGDDTFGENQVKRRQFTSLYLFQVQCSATGRWLAGLKS